MKPQEAEQTIQSLTDKVKRLEDANEALSQQVASTKKPVVVTQNSRRQLKEELAGMLWNDVRFRVLLC
jgi:hypothetical protein